MIIYNPLDGYPLPYNVKSRFRHCFLMTRLGSPVPTMVNKMRRAVEECCRLHGYTVIDAQTRVTGRDFLLKICEIIYENLLISEDPGMSKFRDFLRDERKMAAVFENFVRNFYRLEVPECKVKSEVISWDATPLGDFSSS